MGLGEFVFNLPYFYKIKVSIALSFRTFASLILGIDPQKTEKEVLGSISKYTDAPISVLDIGCGHGNFLELISKEYKIKGYGLDVSKPMIHTAKKEHFEFEFIIGDCTGIPYRDKSFDIVSINWVIHHLTEQQAEATLREALRVGKKALIFQDVTKPDSSLLKYLTSAYWGIYDGGKMYRTKNEWKDFFKNIEYKHIKGAGLDSVFVVEANDRWVPIY